MDHDEELELRKILELLGRAARWVTLTGGKSPSRAWKVEPGSSLAEDNRRTRPYHLSHAAWHALTVAVDHSICLRNSLLGERTEERLALNLHTHAQASLARGAIENAARAVWLIAPANRMTRVTRRLALEAANMRHAYALRDLCGAHHPRPKEQREKQLKGILLKAGLPVQMESGRTRQWAEDAAVKRALRSPQYSEIVRGAGELTGIGGSLAEFLWSGASALAHGDEFGTHGLLDRVIVGREDTNVNLVQVTGSTKFLFRIVSGAVVMLDRGFQVFKSRAVR